MKVENLIVVDNHFTCEVSGLEYYGEFMLYEGRTCIKYCKNKKTNRFSSWLVQLSIETELNVTGCA